MINMLCTFILLCLDIKINGNTLVLGPILTIN